MDHVVHATGSAGTQAGLVVGLRGSNSGVPVYGVSVRAPKEKQEESVWKLVRATMDFTGLPASSVDRGDVVANADYVGRGYGIPTDGRSEEHTSELQSLMRISYAVFCLKKKKRRCKKHYYQNNNIER